MEEGRQIEAGRTAESSDKVIRLPRDWLGPREDLVPFGRATPPPTDPAPPELAAPELAATELATATPTSADDFWGGEAAAGLHDVVQTPHDSEQPAAHAGEPRPPAPKSRLSRRRVAVASAVGIAAVGAIALLLTGSPRHVAAGTGARLNIAAILTDGVSRILNAGPPKVVPRQAPARRPVRHVRHRARVTKSAPPHTSQSSNPQRSTHTYVTRATPTTTYHPPVSESSPHVDTAPPPARSPASSAARVTPTGQAGALGPVHSPNG